jgi:hypothetical protein
MQKYEYLIVGAPGPYKKKWVDYIGQEELNELGNEGWQLVSVLRTGQVKDVAGFQHQRYKFIFLRPKKE